MALTDNLQAFYKLSDTSDSSGNNRTLTNNGNVTFGPNGANFDGTNYLYSNANLENLSEGTLTCKVTFEEASGFYRFVGLQNLNGSVAGGRLLYTENGSFQSTDYSSGAAGGNNPISAGGTYWLATTFASNGDVKIYVNGVYDGVLSGAYQPILGANLHIGNRFELDGSACSVDSVGLWNRALSDLEVTELYNNGTGLELDPPNYQGEWDNFTYYGQDDVVSVSGVYWKLTGLGGWTVGGAPGLGYGWTLLVQAPVGSKISLSGRISLLGRVKFAV